VVRLVDQVEEGLAVGTAEGEEFLWGGGGFSEVGKRGRKRKGSGGRKGDGEKGGGWGWGWGWGEERTE